MKRIMTRTLIVVGLALSALAVIVGLCSSFFGSQADVSPREQSVCLYASNLKTDISTQDMI